MWFFFVRTSCPYPAFNLQNTKIRSPKQIEQPWQNNMYICQFKMQYPIKNKKDPQTYRWERQSWLPPALLNRIKKILNLWDQSLVRTPMFWPWVCVFKQLACPSYYWDTVLFSGDSCDNFSSMLSFFMEFVRLCWIVRRRTMACRIVETIPKSSRS